MVQSKKFQVLTIAGYYPSNSEVDILKFIEKASKKKFKIVLPVIKSSNNANTYVYNSYKNYQVVPV